jgi:endonuclease YncB( thermonuclease family)
MIGKFITTLLLVIFFLPVDFTGKVVKISDGDTIEVMHNGNPEKIRLYGIDCPEISHQAGEIGQPFGQTAKQFTKDLVSGQEVKIIEKDKDRYGRTVAIVELSDGRVLNEELLKAGLAWHYKKYDSNPIWQKMEDDAKAEKKGLWADKAPISPADWRHQGKAAN